MPGRSAEGRAAWQRLRSPRHPRIWFEILLIAVSYGVYSLIRNAVPEQKAQALRNADWIWRVEHSMGLAFEKTVNHAADSVDWLIVSMNYYYATLHFAVTIGVLVWLYRRHPGRYAAIRMVLFSTTAVALLGYYLYPLAPPRLMEGENFIDTVLVHHTWGSMASGDLKNMSNQYAAMPSMHIGWSLWCGLAIFALAKAPWARILGLLYPTATLVVIVATANHFWMDAVGGLLCVGFGLAVVSAWYGALPHRLPRYAGPRPGRGAGVPAPADGVPEPAASGPVAAEPVVSEAAVSQPAMSQPAVGVPAAGVPVTALDAVAAPDAAVAPDAAAGAVTTPGATAVDAGPAPAVGAAHAP